MKTRRVVLISAVVACIVALSVGLGVGLSGKERCHYNVISKSVFCHSSVIFLAAQLSGNHGIPEI